MDARLPIVRTVTALMQVMDAADPHTRGRSLRIARWSVRLAKQLGAPEHTLTDIELGALLHDLGRNAILNDVVQSPRALDASERAVVQTHPTIGWDMLREIPGLEAAAAIVYTHHERPDGKGYPRQLPASDIPLGARIVMVCSAYDAMTEERPYRQGLSPTAACAELRKHSGTQFFPDVVEAFITLLESGKLWDGFTREELDAQGRRLDAPRAA